MNIEAIWKIEEKRIASIETAKGSIYYFLPDGRTQRFKKVENKQYEPQDVLVFIPDWETLSLKAPKDFLDRFENSKFEFKEIILEYCHSMKIYIIDKDGNKIDSNEKAKTASQIFLAFCKDSDSPADFIIPVSVKPKIGWNIYDTRKYFNETKQKWEREQHIGNKVAKINYL